MKNVFLFFWKNQFSILFILLEIIGFALLGSNSGFHQSQLHQTGVALSGNVYQIQHAYTQYLGLSDENAELREENADLLEQLINQPKRQSVNRDGYKVIPVQAINSTHHLKNNFIVIRSGSVDGIKPASAVIGPSGIVGIVHSVSDHYSSILPLIHSSTNINARLQRTSYFGQCHWVGIDEEIMTLENIPNHVVVNPGDTILTRGGGGIFPSGLVLGFAESSEKNESSGFQEIQVKLATDFKKINTLFVIENTLKQELDSIMIQTEAWIDK